METWKQVAVPSWRKKKEKNSKYDAANASIFITSTVLLANIYLATTKINTTENWQNLATQNISKFASAGINTSEN